jgi:hypothetical protein
MIHLLIARAMLNADPAEYPVVLEKLSLAEKSAPADADVPHLCGKRTRGNEPLRRVRGGYRTGGQEAGQGKHWRSCAGGDAERCRGCESGVN